MRAVARWIGIDNPSRATSFSSELRRACLTLARHPARYPVVIEAGRNAVRKRVHGQYLILYRILEKEVEILRIVHGARDWATILGE